MNTKLSLSTATGLLLLVLLMLLGAFTARAAQFARFDAFGAHVFQADFKDFTNEFRDFDIAFAKVDFKAQDFTADFGEGGFGFSNFS
jgi:hypothetical protein